MTEIHVHLDGSLRPQTVWELALKNNLETGARNMDDLEDKLTVPPGCVDLNGYLKCFALPLQVLQTPESVARAVAELIEDMGKDGVTSGEIRFAPQLHTTKGHTQREITEGAIDGLRQALAQSPDFCGNLILCCMRGNGNRKENEETLRVAAGFLGHGVCAVDLAGAEALFPTSDYAGLFAKARGLGLPFTIHAGEALGPSSVKDALAFGAKRIGHGVRAIEDKELITELVREKITLEVCVTSNLQTHVFPEAVTHPIHRLFEMGARVTVNTDNRTVSGTTMRKERTLLKDRYGFTEEELWVMEEYAQEGRFQ